MGVFVVLTVLLFLCGLMLSGIAAAYSIFGLLAIFPAAPYTIIAMGSALEAAKLVIASWLYRSWAEAPLLLKTYFSVALLILMFLTSMSIFGFLSKAHMDSAVVTGDSVAALSIVDERIATQKENIKQARSALTQMDSQVNELLARSADDKGAAKAVTIRKQQKSEREALQKEIQVAQTEVTNLQTERAPLATKVRVVEAEVGPIKYIAQLMYGDKVTDDILDKAVRIVILMIVSVFDVLAVLMLIAANWNLKHNTRKKTVITKHHIETVEDTTEITENESALKCQTEPAEKTKVQQNALSENTVAFPSTSELKEKYKDVFDNEAVSAVSRWQDESLGNVHTSQDLIDRALKGDTLDGNAKSLLDAFHDESIPLAVQEGEEFHEDVTLTTLPADIANVETGNEWLTHDEVVALLNDENSNDSLLTLEKPTHGTEIAQNTSTDILHSEETTSIPAKDNTTDTSDTTHIASTQTVAIGNSVALEDSLSIALNGDTNLLYTK